MAIELDQEPQAPLTPTGQAQHLAMLLQSIAELQLERAQYLAEWKARNDNLRNAATKLAREILTGQMPLIPTEEPKQ
jgi:hypothetical protein